MKWLNAKHSVNDNELLSVCGNTDRQRPVHRRRGWILPSRRYRALIAADHCLETDRPTGLTGSPTKPRWRRIVSSNIFLGFALTLVAWPSSPSSLVVVSGLDSSWKTTLAIAAHNAMPFGTHIVFTYGPLGFLQDQQLNYRLIAVLSLLFALALSTAIFGALIWSLRRVVPLASGSGGGIRGRGRIPHLRGRSGVCDRARAHRLCFRAHPSR